MPTSGFSPYNAEQTAIERRRKFAELLQQQAMQPEPTQMVSGRAVPHSPVQGLAKLAQALMGARGVSQADEQTKGLSGRYSAALAQALGGMPQGTPAVPEVQGTSFEEPGQAAQRAIPATMAENMKWLGELGGISPQAVTMGSAGLQMQQHAQDRAGQTQRGIQFARG